jgi:hypothetical protein
MTAARSAWTWATGLFFVLVGIALAAGGAWLIARGGSWYYLPGGLAVAATGILLVRRQRAALWLYASFLLGTLAWAIAEAGLDWWQLLPRLDLWFAMGAWLLLPWLNRRLGDPREDPRAGNPALRITLALTLLTGLVALTRDGHALRGTFADRPAGIAATAPGGTDWIATPTAAIATRQRRRSRPPTPADCRSPGPTTPETCGARTTRRNSPPKPPRSRPMACSTSARRTTSSSRWIPIPAGRSGVSIRASTATRAITST